MEKEIQTVGHTLNFIRISNGAAIGKEFRVKICQIAAQSGLCESVVKDCINSLIKQGTITFLMRSDNSYSSCKILNEIFYLTKTVFYSLIFMQNFFAERKEITYENKNNK